MSKAKLKTTPNHVSVNSYLQSLPTAEAKSDAAALKKLFEAATREKAVMWGSSIVGFGKYHYTYESGREGDFLATGFSIRKSGSTIYIMPGYHDYSDILAKLGPHKLGKSCLYIRRLSDIDQRVLTKLIKAGLRDLKKLYPVK